LAAVCAFKSVSINANLSQAASCPKTWAKIQKVREFGNSGLFPSHKMIPLQELKECRLRAYHRFKSGAGKSLRMLQGGLFPSHKINLWISSKEQA
jgi:hypothetical protein